MPQRKNNPQAPFVGKPEPKGDRNRMRIEPAPNSPGELIDPADPDAQRKFEIQQRGGAYDDRMRLDPDRPRTKMSIQRPGMEKTKV